MVSSFTIAAKDKEIIPNGGIAQGKKMMSRAESQKIAAHFYQYFNASELDKLFLLISKDISHEINHGGIISGKDAFIDHITTNKKHYDEHVHDLIFMVSDDARYVAVKFNVRGKYILTDASQIPAKGQTYKLSALNCFEIENGQIIHATGWYDEDAWLRQVS